ncbi:DUF3048 domain-containing protein [Clostridium fallax]|uniref:Lipoprotein YerB n=1 Tax=Clostridium fallax TaxID=1533 RepID=A0A1M4TBX1_9CLOT|nr:DUF3048 domain-containing protein [Clostridium fallax]SHE41953.1 Protein of unknown function [Clostridium fallax]SQB22692.1 Putative lipoprotein yerB precursor [Clostridium fallax]
MNKALVLIPIIVSTTFLGCSLERSKKPKETSPVIYRREAPPAISEDKSAPKSLIDNISPYSGSLLNDNSKNNIPFMAIIENSKAARPQSGLSQAEIVYETLAEGGIPRFLALFYKNQPNKIGPIRSIRPYFLDISNEYNLPIAHCGGSEEALASISSDTSSKTIDEIKNASYFWRENKLSPPHNLFTSSDKITKYISEKKIKYDTFSPIIFDDEFWKNNKSSSCTSLYLKQSSGYNTSYKYKDNKYYKFMDGKEAIDSLNNKPLSFDNIVIQKAKTKVKDDKGHLEINFIGEGDAFVISKGKVQNVKWKKKDKNSSTELLDKNNNKIPLSSGHTIWHIIDPEVNLNIKE